MMKGKGKSVEELIKKRKEKVEGKIIDIVEKRIKGIVKRIGKEERIEMCERFRRKVIKWGRGIRKKKKDEMKEEMWKLGKRLSKDKVKIRRRIRKKEKERGIREIGRNDVVGIEKVIIRIRNFLDGENIKRREGIENGRKEIEIDLIDEDIGRRKKMEIGIVSIVK